MPYRESLRRRTSGTAPSAYRSLGRQHMDVRAYFESLGLELEALKKRVRYVIAGAHWQTDGEWKESAMRQILRRHLPANAVVGRGFVVSNDAVSTQIDVLIRDASKPVVFSDGDLACVTPDAVLGIIEVKSSLVASQCRDAALKLASNIELVRLHPNSKAVAGLFSFESSSSPDAILSGVADAATTWNQRVDFLAAGGSTFVKYWHLQPPNERRAYETWHLYHMPGLSAGYFVHNVIDSICPESTLTNQQVWFPSDGKEQYLVGTRRSQWATVIPPS